MTDDRKRGGHFAELKQRNVFRVAIAYILSAWVSLQIIDVLFPALTLPEWGIPLVAALLILGFPLVIFFAWAKEIRARPSTSYSGNLANYGGWRAQRSLLTRWATMSSQLPAWMT